MAEITEAPKFRVGTKLWRIVEGRAGVACGRCGGGGQLYDEEADTRGPCPACQGAGVVQRQVWHPDPAPRRSTTCLLKSGGGGYHYFLEGVEGPVPEADLFDSWGAATEAAWVRWNGEGE